MSADRVGSDRLKLRAKQKRVYKVIKAGLLGYTVSKILVREAMEITAEKKREKSLNVFIATFIPSRIATIALKVYMSTKNGKNRKIASAVFNLALVVYILLIRSADLALNNIKIMYFGETVPLFPNDRIFFLHNETSSIYNVSE